MARQRTRGSARPRARSAESSVRYEIGAEHAGPRHRGIVWLILAALAAITVLAYTPVWRFDFLALDDPGYVTANPNVTGGLTPSSVRWAMTTGHEANWHPITWLSHMVDVELFGVNGGAHHVVNLVLHVASALLLFLVLRALTGALWRPAFVAAIFAVHPLHVESVAWVAERKDVLSGLFFMLTLGAYVRYRRSPSRARYALVALMLAFGLMCKPMLVTVPFVLLLIDWWRGAERMRPMVVEKIPLFLLVLASSIITFIAQREFGATKSLSLYPFALRIQNACVSYLEYLKDAVWPVGLAAFYPFPSALPIDTVLISALILLGLTTAALAFANRDRVWATGWFWFAGMLVPVIGLVQVGNQARADRYMYLPLIGLSIAVAWGIGARLRAAVTRRVVGVLAGAAVVACAVITQATVQHWRDTEALWSHTARVTEGTGNFGVYFGLAEYLRAHNRREDAVTWYQGAVQRNPDHFESRRALGLLLVDLNRLPEAGVHLAQAARLRPDEPEVQWQLGLTLASSGRVGDALPMLAEAARLSPASATIRNDYGWALIQHGQVVEGTREIEAVLKIDPLSVNAHHNLGRVLLARGDANRAITHLREAVRLSPDFLEARLSVARALASMQQMDAARAEVQEVLRRSPGHPGALKLLGALGGR